MSDGISLCLDEGLTSGKMLDYVYRREPSGKGFFGRWLDRYFLNHPGWEAVRQRRSHLERLLLASIDERKKATLIFDIASGPASYIFSVLKKSKRIDVSAVCQDLEPRWIEEGKVTAKKSGCSQIEFLTGDAFNPPFQRFKPDIVVASGFYDWINEDAKIVDSIQKIYSGLSSGGRFILTIQTDHPNLSLAQKIFTDFNKAPLRMTMRSNETMTRWLTAAGFVIEEKLSDENNFYTVFKAVKQ